MKMRLIDAEELLKEFDPDGEMISPIAARIKIVQQPTAYDMDKVVEQLRKREICKNCLNNLNPITVCATFCDIGKKLEIVKAGGVK